MHQLLPRRATVQKLGKVLHGGTHQEGSPPDGWRGHRKGKFSLLLIESTSVFTSMFSQLTAFLLLLS